MLDRQREKNVDNEVTEEAAINEVAIFDPAAYRMDKEILQEIQIFINEFLQKSSKVYPRYANLIFPDESSPQHFFSIHKMKYRYLYLNRHVIRSYIIKLWREIDPELNFESKHPFNIWKKETLRKKIREIDKISKKKASPLDWILIDDSSLKKMPLSRSGPDVRPKWFTMPPSKFKRIKSTG